jgi:DNA-3-methyladenine glycosylase
MTRDLSQAQLLRRGFYERSPEIVARALLGKILVHDRRGERLAGRITETEAYLGLGDAASHAFTGLSAFNAVLFGPAGYTDVFLIYGMHYCLNVSCLPDGEPGGVLFRAVDPLEGIATMARLRGLEENASAKSLTGGPGRLSEAFGITRAKHHGIDVTRTDSILRILDDGGRPKRVEVTARIGIRKGADQPLRFVVADKLATVRAR